MGTKKIRHMPVVVLAALGAAAIGLAAPANADRDTEFASELRTFGVYGQRDYNAWIAKIQCKRLHTGLDANAGEAAVFLKTNLHKDSTEQQVYQYLNSAINFYCPDQRYVVDSIAGIPAPAPVPAGTPLPAERG